MVVDDNPAFLRSVTRLLSVHGFAMPEGAPLQLKAGERLPPVQPNPLNTCSLAMCRLP
jgi:hypothetical protein